jgi:hypothetical protein
LHQYGRTERRLVSFVFTKGEEDFFFGESFRPCRFIPCT